QLLDRLRSDTTQGRNPAKEEAWPDDSVAEMAGRIGVLTSLGLKESVQLIRNALKPIDFEIVWMRCVDELEWEDITVILNEQSGASDTKDRYTKRYVRALAALQATMSNPLSSSLGPRRS